MIAVICLSCIGLRYLRKLCEVLGVWCKKYCPRMSKAWIRMLSSIKRAWRRKTISLRTQAERDRVSGADLEAHMTGSEHDQVKAQVQAWLKESVFRTGLSFSLCQCAGSAVRDAVVLRVTRIDNTNLFGMYQQMKDTKHRELLNFQDKVPHLGPRTLQPSNVSSITSPLNSTINELFLFHGTSYEKAQTIVEQGFDQNVSSAGALYGMGIYFSDSSCKANQYTRPCQASGLMWINVGATKPTPGRELNHPGLAEALENLGQVHFSQEEWDTFAIDTLLADDFIQSGDAYFKPAQQKAMLLCRVLMGWPHCTDSSHAGIRRPTSNDANDGKPFDSVFAESGVAHGGTQRHNEYVVFDKWQVYPEYLVLFSEK